MNQLRGLLLDHFDDFGMTMTRRADGDAGVGIEKDVAVHVFDPHARAAFGDEFICGARVRWINELVIGGDDLLPTRAGQSGFDLRPFKRRDGAGSHNTSPYDETETDQVEISNLKFQRRGQRQECEATPRRCSRGCRGGECNRKRIWTSRNSAVQIGAQLLRRRIACPIASARKIKPPVKPTAISKTPPARNKSSTPHKSHDKPAIVKNHTARL